MQPGKLDRRIRIDRKVTTQDAAYGTEVITWSTFATVWAELQDVLPSRSEQAGENIVIASLPMRIRLRYLAGLSSDMRVVLLDRGNRELKIIAGPAEMGRREGMEIMAESYSTAGSAV